MNLRAAALSLFAVSTFALVACGGGGSSATNTPTLSAAAAADTTVHTASNATLGKTILVNSAGLTLYTHDGDTLGTSSCTGSCASVWPPLPAGTGAQTGGPGVTGILATTTRPDGAKQVTYNGKPLYTLRLDGTAGRVIGDGVNGFRVATP